MKIRVIASGSAGNCYWISDGRTSLLLDAGIPLPEIQRGCEFGISDIEGCLITHSHGDHVCAAANLARYGVDIFASSGTIEECDLRGHRIHPVSALEPFTVGSFRILPFDVEHDAPEPLGFLLASASGEKLLYFTDTYYLKYRFSGVTHMLAECNYDTQTLRRSVEEGRIAYEQAARLYRSHMSLDHLLELLQVNDLGRLRQIYLIHMSQNNADAARMKRAVQRATGAEVYIC